MKTMSRRKAERRFAKMLTDAGLPRFASTFHDADIHLLHFTWDNGFTIFMDLTRDDWEEIDDSERAGILGLPYDCCDGFPPIDVYVAGSADDPRTEKSIPGVTIHRGPPLHPDDLTVHKGIPCTSLSRTLIDCAEVVSIDELRDMFAHARDIGLLDPEAMRAARARVEWRPSLAMLDVVIEEFC